MVGILACRRARRRPATLSELLALGSPLGGALSDQREGRAEWGGWKLPAGACPGGRCSRGRLAARKLPSAVRKAARGVAQSERRRDAGPGAALRAGGEPLPTGVPL